MAQWWSVGLAGVKAWVPIPALAGWGHLNCRIHGKLQDHCVVGHLCEETSYRKEKPQSKSGVQELGINRPGVIQTGLCSDRHVWVSWGIPAVTLMLPTSGPPLTFSLSVQI